MEWIGPSRLGDIGRHRRSDLVLFVAWPAGGIFIRSHIFLAVSGPIYFSSPGRPGSCGALTHLVTRLLASLVPGARSGDGDAHG